MIDKKNFVSAKFIDNEKQTIEVLLKDGDAVYSHIIEAKDESKDFEELLKIVSLDEIHENTVNHNREQRQLFEEEVKRIAEGEGLTFKNLQQDEVFDIVINTIMEETNAEDLFKFKLKVFDIHSVKENKSRDVKAEIRKATSIAGVISAFSKI
jgi:hypothetical protein